MANDLRILTTSPRIELTGHCFKTDTIGPLCHIRFKFHDAVIQGTLTAQYLHQIATWFVVLEHEMKEKTDDISNNDN